jgi:GT2 family glycosyltransferase
MQLNFHVVGHQADIPMSESTYVVETFLGRPCTNKLSNAIAKVVDLEDYPEAFVWDDLVYSFSRKGRLTPFRLEWPYPDVLLYPHVKHIGRCAIRSDILFHLMESGKISRHGDTSAALAWLCKNQAKQIVHLDDILRFVGWQDSDIYRPLSFPEPEFNASSISIIINYRDRPELMVDCLKSIVKQKVTASLEVILVDNQSQPENRRIVEERARSILPPNISVKHLTYDAPFNHSAQSNLGAENAMGEVLVMLNNDAQFQENQSLQILANWAITPGVASVGPRALGDKGRLVSSGVQTCQPLGSRPTRIQESTVLPLAQTIHYSAGNGFACAAISRKIWCGLGGLDSVEFPTQYNDADFFLRALNAGFQHIYLGHLTIYHEPGQSESRTRDIVEKIHDKLRLMYSDLVKYSRINPGLVKETSDVRITSINAPILFKTFTTYRRLYKRLELLKSRSSLGQGERS